MGRRVVQTALAGALAVLSLGVFAARNTPPEGVPAVPVVPAVPQLPPGPASSAEVRQGPVCRIDVVQVAPARATRIGIVDVPGLSLNTVALDEPATREACTLGATHAVPDQVFTDRTGQSRVRVVLFAENVPGQPKEKSVPRIDQRGIQEQPPVQNTFPQPPPGPAEPNSRTF